MTGTWPRSVLVPFLIGVLGMVVGLAGWHAWNDHALVDLIRQDLARQQQQARPSAPEAP